MSKTRVDLDNSNATMAYFQNLVSWLFSIIELKEGSVNSDKAKEYFHFLLALREKDNALSRKQTSSLHYCFTLFYAFGIGCEKNIELAKQHLAELEKRAYDSNLPAYDLQYAKYELGFLLTNEIPEVSKINYEKATSLLVDCSQLMQGPISRLNRLRELKLLPAEACYKVGVLLETGCNDTKHKPDFNLAREFYEAGVAQSSSECAYALARLYGQGKQFLKDVGKQAQYLLLSFKLDNNRALRNEPQALKELIANHPTNTTIVMAAIEMAHLQNLQQEKESFIDLLKRQALVLWEPRLALAKIQAEGLFGTQPEINLAFMNLNSIIAASPIMIDPLEKEAITILTDLALKRDDLTAAMYLRAGILLQYGKNPDREKSLQCLLKGKSAECALQAAWVYKSQGKLPEMLHQLQRVGELDLLDTQARIDASRELERLLSKHPLRSNSREAVDVMVTNIRFVSKHLRFAAFIDRVKIRLNDLSALANSLHENAAYAALGLAKVLDELPANTFTSPADFYVRAYNQAKDPGIKAQALERLIQLANRDSSAAAAVSNIILSPEQHAQAKAAQEQNLDRLMHEIANLADSPLRQLSSKILLLKTQLDLLTSCMSPDLLQGLYQALDAREKEAKKLCFDYINLLSGNLDIYLKQTPAEIAKRQVGVQELLRVTAELKGSHKNLPQLMEDINKIETFLKKKNAEKKSRTLGVKSFYREQETLVTTFLDKALQTEVELNIAVPAAGQSKQPELPEQKVDAPINLTSLPIAVLMPADDVKAAADAPSVRVPVVANSLSVVADSSSTLSGPDDQVTGQPALPVMGTTDQPTLDAMPLPPSVSSTANIHTALLSSSFIVQAPADDAQPLISFDSTLPSTGAVTPAAVEAPPPLNMADELYLLLGGDQYAKASSVATEEFFNKYLPQAQQLNAAARLAAEKEKLQQQEAAAKLEKALREECLRQQAIAKAAPPVQSAQPEVASSPATAVVITADAAATQPAPVVPAKTTPNPSANPFQATINHFELMKNSAFPFSAPTPKQPAADEKTAPKRQAASLLN